uniref:C2H2-type domain-containing protein n=1 Tax=Plectus sambesii TaxID=2011161 RepID=A0A914XBQ1_9BILA
MSMLRKLKQQVAQAVGSASEQHNQHHVGNSSNSSTNGSGYVQIGEDQQGFLCPVCMTTFSAPEQLQYHFSKAHAEPAAPVDQTDSPGLPDVGSEGERTSRSSSFSDDNLTNGAFTCPQCFAQLPNGDELQRHFREQHELSESRSDGDLLSMQLEMKDLRSAVQEEKWYSSELKKELDRLQLHIQARGADLSALGSDEPAYLMQQIQMLEAGKAMVTQRMLELEKECGTQKRLNDAMQREKERVLEKSAHMAKEVVMLKSQMDEEYAQKQMLGDDMIRVKAIVDSLEKQLDQRPSEDDVNVLRKELVHAQTLMDTITQEKENEIAQLTLKLNETNLKHDEAQKVIKMMNEQLNAAPKNEDVLLLETSAKEATERLQEELSQKAAEVAALKEQLATVSSIIRLLLRFRSLWLPTS